MYKKQDKSYVTYSSKAVRLAIRVSEYGISSHPTDNRLFRVGHGLDSSMNWTGLGGMALAAFLRINNHYSTVDAVSF